MARLARLADRSPLVVALCCRNDPAGHDHADHVEAPISADTIDSSQKNALQEREIRVVVKIRPLQLHYLVNGQLAVR